MAKSRNNVITHGLSGKIGDMLVFSQRNGKTIVGKVPRPSSKEPSAAQKQQSQRFQQAILYAKAATGDAATKEAYKAAAEPGLSAYNVAVADLLNAPHIESIDLSGYNGQVGSKIMVRATDDFKVAAVTISISNDDGSLVETGNAQPHENGLDWVYTASTKNDRLEGDKIVVQVSDMPANMTEETRTIA